MEDEGTLFLLPKRLRKTAPKTSSPCIDSMEDGRIPLFYNDGRSIVGPFGRQKLIDSVLASCSDCRVVSVLRRQQSDKSTAASKTPKKRRHCPEQPCNYCKKVLEAQRYISKTLFYITQPQDDAERQGQAVDVYVTGPNVTMVSINSDSMQLPSISELTTSFSDDCWYGPSRMNVGDTLTLTNLHAKRKPSTSSNGCSINTSWDDLHFLLCSNHSSSGIFTTASNTTITTVHMNSGPSYSGKLTVQPKLWPSLKDIQCALSRQTLHTRELHFQQDFIYNNNDNVTKKCLELTSHMQDNPNNREVTTHQQTSHSEVPVEEESPMLTLPHFSCSSNWADSHHLNGSATKGVHDDNDVEAIGMDHLDGTPTIQVGSSEDTKNNIIIRPLASMSFQELYELREEYAPNTFRHALLSIALMRAEKIKRDENKSQQILLPWLLRDTVVILRKKKPFTVTTA